MRQSTIGKICCLIIFTIGIAGCSESLKQKNTDQSLSHQLIKKLTDVIVVDIFTPPVASRIYANCSLAIYEAVRFGDGKSTSLAAKLNGFDSMPVPEKGKQYDFSIAAIQSFCETAKKVTFSAAEIKQYQDSMINVYGKGLEEEVVKILLLLVSRLQML